jgi:hypothetical protein
MQYQSYDFENDSYQDTLYENEDSVMEGFYATPDSPSSGGNSCNMPNSNGGNNSGGGTSAGGINSGGGNWFSKVRAMNIEQIDEQYNKYLADYLNSYHNYLVLKNLSENATFNLQSSSGGLGDLDKRLVDAKKNYESSQGLLEGIAAKIIQNNEETQKFIEDQTAAIKTKRALIESKQSIISKQQSIVSEKTKVLNTRERQVELGVTKNLYKRNSMYFLIVINVIVLVILSGLIYKSSKQ